MLTHCCCLWTLLITLPVLILTQKYYMNFIFNNNRYVKGQPPLLNGTNSSNLQKSGLQPEIEDGKSVETAEKKHEEEKISMRAPKATSKTANSENSEEASEESRKSDKSGQRDHAHSFSHEHSDSHEVIHRNEIPSREHTVRLSPSLERDISDYDNDINTDEDEIRLIHASLETDRRKGQRTTKNKTKDNNDSKGDIAIQITNNTIVDDFISGQGSKIDNDTDLGPVRLEPNTAGQVSNVSEAPIIVDNIDFEDIFKDELRINNILCKQDPNVNEAFGLTLSAEHVLKFKFQCDINGYKDRWLLVLRESFPSYRYFPDFSSGFAPKDYHDVAISMDSLNYITANRNMQLLLIGRDNQNQVVYAKYDNFIIGDVHEEFALKSLGHYEGNATNWLNYFLNNNFSDYLKIYVEKFDCEIMKLGGWWAHNTTHCTFPENRDPESIGSLEMYIQEAPVNHITTAATTTTPTPITETPKIKIS